MADKEATLNVEILTPLLTGQSDQVAEQDAPAEPVPICPKSVRIQSEADTSDVSSDLPESVPSEASILTRITEVIDDEFEFDQSLCLLVAKESNSQIFNDNKASFSPNADPGIESYMAKVESDSLKGWDRYQLECYKYSMPMLTPVKEVIVDRALKLDLKNYCPQTIGIWLACETIVREKSTIEQIDMSNSPFSESGCCTLNDVLETSKTLESLKLANCMIGYKGVKALEDGLNIMTAMVELDLSNCNLKDAGGVIVVMAMANNDTVKYLNLKGNQLQTETSKACKDMLIKNETLEFLDLGWNNLNQFESIIRGKKYEQALVLMIYINTACLKPFLNGLKINTSLIRLVLSWNGMPCSGDFAECFKKSMSKNETLKYLDLENNRLTGEMEDFFAGIQKSSSLVEVKLGGNPLSDLDIAVILNTFTKQATMEHLSLGEYRWLTKQQTQIIATKINAINPQLRISYQGTLMSMTPRPPVDFKGILMDRLKFLAMKPKKKKLKKDMGHFFYSLLDDAVDRCSPEDWLVKVKQFGAKVDDTLCEQIAVEWQNPKSLNVALHDMAHFYLARHPTERPPPVVAKIAEPKKGGKQEKKKKK